VNVQVNSCTVPQTQLKLPKGTPMMLRPGTTGVVL